MALGLYLQGEVRCSILVVSWVSPFRYCSAAGEVTQGLDSFAIVAFSAFERSPFNVASISGTLRRVGSCGGGGS